MSTAQRLREAAHHARQILNENGGSEDSERVSEIADAAVAALVAAANVAAQSKGVGV